MHASRLPSDSSIRRSIPTTLALALALTACGGNDGADVDVDPADAGPVGPADALTPSCDPAAFRRERLPDDGIANTELRDLHGTAPDDVWAVTNVGRILHRDAASWTQTERLAGALDSVWAVDRRSAYAVGQFGFIGHWDGATWNLERRVDDPRNDILELRGVHAASADQVWAVGDRALGGAVVLRRNPGGAAGADGTAWTAVTPPAGARHGLRAVWIIAADNVWVAGQDGAFSWNGATWTRRQSDDLIDVVATVDGTVWTLRSVSFQADGLCHISGSAAPACEKVPGGEVVFGKALTLIDGAPALAAYDTDLGRDIFAQRVAATWQLADLDSPGFPMSVFGTGTSAWLGTSEAVIRRGCD